MIRKISGLNNYVVNEVVHQGEYSKAIFSESTNTVRVLTVRWNEQELFIPATVHRFGANGLRVDNWSQGGLCSSIDLETGVLGAAVRHPANSNWKMEWHDKHPDSQNPIKGVKIPYWRNICSTLIGLAESHGFRYVGWDVIVGNEGFWILEGNAFSDLNLFQVHVPLLKSPQMRAFMNSVAG